MQQSDHHVPAATRAEAFVDQLILRWGVLIRDLLTERIHRTILEVICCPSCASKKRAGNYEPADL